MLKRIITLCLTVLIALLPFTSCSDRYQEPAENYEHMFYGKTGPMRDNSISIEPISGSNGELEYNQIYVNTTSVTGEKIDYFQLNTRVCVKYNGDITVDKNIIISEIVSITPAVIPSTFGDTLFNIGLVNRCVGFHDDSMNNSLNANRTPEEGKYNLPVYLINNTQDMENYFYGNIFPRMYNSEGEPYTAQSVFQYLDNYDKSFFKNKSLLLVFISWHTGSADFEIADIEKSQCAIEISVNNLYSGMTCDSGEWIFIIEVDKNYLQGVTDFNASINAPL